MDIDEQLLNAREREKKEADKSAARSEALREARRGLASNDASGQIGQGNQPQSLREAAQQASLKKEAEQKKGGALGVLKDKAVSAAMAPISKATSGWLRQAWLNLIDTFGLTLIWINVHVLLSFILGDKFFCKLGDEWDRPDRPGSRV